MAGTTDLAFKLFAIDEASPVFARVAKSAEESGAAVESAGKKHAGAAAAIGKFANAGVAAGVLIAGSSLKMAADFQEGLTTLVTGAGESEKNLKLVGDGIKSISTMTGTSTKELTDGMYMIESAGYHGKQGLDVLTKAAEGAKVGNASLGDVANGVTTIMTDYAGSHVNATQATNGLIKAVASGKTHMQDLAVSMATIAPIAATVGVSMNEMLGGMAELTSRGVPAAVAATMLKQTLLNIKTPSNNAKKSLKELGLGATSLSTMMGKKGLAATFQFLREKMKQHHLTSAQTVTALKNISGGTKTLAGALILSGQGLEGFKEKTKAVAEATDKGKKGIEGWGEVQKDFNFKLEKFKAAIQVAAINIGQKLLPVFTKLVDKVSPFLPLILKVVGALIAMAVIAKIVIMVAKFVNLMITLGKILRFAAVGMGLLDAEMDANPIGLVVLAIAALVAGIVWVATKTTWFQTIWKYAWGGIKTAALGTWHFLQTTFRTVMDFLHGKWGWLLAFLGPVGWLIAIAMHWKQVWTGIQNVAKTVWGGLKTAWHATTSFISNTWHTTWNAISGFGKAIWHALSAYFTTAWKVWVAAFHIVITDLSNLWHTTWNAVSSFGKSVWHGISSFFTGAWHEYTRFFQGMLTGLSNAWHAVWTRMEQTGKNVWSNIKNGALSSFRTMRDGLSTIWNSVANTAKTIWARVQSAVAAPVRFVVNTVMGGMAGAWNSVVSKVGLGSLRLPVPHVNFADGGYANFASGGAVRGPGGPRSDKIPAMLSNGEYVIPAHVVKAQGVDFFDSMLGRKSKMSSRMPFVGGDQSTIKGYAGIPNPINIIKSAAKKVVSVAKGVGSWVLGALTKGVVANVIEAPFKAMLGNIPGGGVVGDLFKSLVPKLLGGMLDLFMKKNDAAATSGGTLPYKGNALDWAKSQVGKRYQWGGNGNPSWDCSGFMSAIESVIRGEHPHRRWATGAFSGSSGPPGWVRNAMSPFRIGITNAGVGHTAGTLGGVNVECRGGVGCLVGHSARGFNDHLFTSHWGLKLPGVKGFASGGLMGRGWSIVGEAGPEMVYSRGGASVLSHQRTKSMLSGTSGPQHHGTVEVVIKNESGKEIERKLVTLKARRGGRKFSWEG